MKCKSNRAIYKLKQERNWSDEDVDALLKVLRTDLQLAHVAESSYVLNEAGKVCLPFCCLNHVLIGLQRMFPPLRKRTGKLNGIKFQYVHLHDVAKEWLGRLTVEELSSQQFTYVPSPDIGHPASSKRFKQCTRCHKQQELYSSHFLIIYVL